MWSVKKMAKLGGNVSAFIFWSKANEGLNFRTVDRFRSNPTPYTTIFCLFEWAVRTGFVALRAIESLFIWNVVPFRNSILKPITLGKSLHLPIYLIRIWPRYSRYFWGDFKKILFAGSVASSVIQISRLFRRFWPSENYFWTIFEFKKLSSAEMGWIRM